MPPSLKNTRPAVLTTSPPPDHAPPPSGDAFVVPSGYERRNLQLLAAGHGFARVLDRAGADVQQIEGRCAPHPLRRPPRRNVPERSRPSRTGSAGTGVGACGCRLQDESEQGAGGHQCSGAFAYVRRERRYLLLRVLEMSGAGGRACVAVCASIACPKSPSLNGSRGICTHKCGLYTRAAPVAGRLPGRGPQPGAMSTASPIGEYVYGFLVRPSRCRLAA